MQEHILWSFQSAFLFVLILVGLMITVLLGSRTAMDIKKIKDEWSTNRCSPLIMPFAGFFGYNTKDNFEFCMGKIFSTHSQSYMGSITSIVTKFTTILQSIFSSINSLRTTIASLGGGINVIFQEFTERISMFFFRLRMSAIYLKSLFMRMYALLFSVMYMGMSGITGMTSFTNTFLFSFIDTFCFPADTLLQVEREKIIQMIPIKDIKIGDILQPNSHRVTACFNFYSKGQPMVKLGNITVSTNHYVQYNKKYIKAGEHPDAISIGPWNLDEPLYCLNTETNHIPIDSYLFLDYDETSVADKEGMLEVEKHINAGKTVSDNINVTEHGCAISSNARICTEQGIRYAKDIQLGDKLTTGSVVVGIIRKKVKEYSIMQDDIYITPSTLYWDKNESIWKRWGNMNKWNTATRREDEKELCSFIAVPNSQLELENGLRIRDYMEWCSPDAEGAYSRAIENSV